MKTSSPLFRFFFEKRIFSTLVLILIILSGLLAYQSLVKEAMPDIEIPMAIITTTWPGAAPELVEKQLTTPIEKNIKTLSGVDRYFSISRNSASLMLVYFEADASMEESMQLLRTKVREAEKEFPDAANDPVITEASVNDAPVMTFILFGDLDDGLMDRYAREIKEKLEILPGVRKAEVSGSRKEIVSIQLKPSILAELGISPRLVQARIAEANIDMPWGTFEEPRFNAMMELQGRFRDIEQLQALPIVRLEQGRVVRLREIATVRRDLEAETTRSSISANGEQYAKAVSIGVYKSPGEDAVDIIQRVRKMLAQTEKSAEWPLALEYRIVYEESELIWDTLKEAFNNVWQAMIGVFIILFLLLSWREAIIAGLSIPITFLGALAVLWMVGYTLNAFVIFGMVLALGLLVDDFILVMEGMHDGLSRGLTLPQAQRFTIKTYAVPSLSGSLTTILAMSPLIAMGGIEGAFIRVIPLTAVICLSLSFLISILIDIPLAPLFLRQRQAGTAQLSRIDRITERISGNLSGWLQRYAVRNKWIAVLWCAGTVVLFVGGLIAFVLLPKEMFPKAESDRNIGISIELAPDADLERSQAVADIVGELLRQKPYFENVTKYVGMKSPLTRVSEYDYLTDEPAPYFSGMTCLLVPKEQRDKLNFEYVDELRAEIEAELAQIPGAVLTITARGDDASNATPIQLDIYGSDVDQLRRISTDIQQALLSIPGTTGIRDSFGPARFNWQFTPQREALDFYGISEADLAVQIRTAMSSDKVGEFVMPGTKDNLDMMLGMAWPSRNGQSGGPKRWEELYQINVFNARGQAIPAYSLLADQIDQASVAIAHKNGDRVVTVMSKVSGRTANAVFLEVLPKLEAMQETWPTGYHYGTAGEAEQLAKSMAQSGKAMLVAFVMVFGILALLFDSFKQPLIIMFSVPFALIGVFGGFFLAWIPMSFVAFIGIISLVGIAVNDAIVLIETMNHHRRNGLSVKEAAARGAGDRLRPIISTTLTTTVGLTPLALSNPTWMPLCSAIIFGLLASTLICIFVIPCLYLLLTSERKTAVDTQSESELAPEVA